MKRIVALLKTDIGRKALMGITGLLMIGFLVTHMLANLLVLFNPEAYNHYSENLTSNPLIYLAELGLVLFFVGHDGVRVAFAFLLFRIFDIFKPPPIRQLDKALKNGFGVMADDLLAAGYTLLAMAIWQRLMG